MTHTMLTYTGKTICGQVEVFSSAFLFFRNNWLFKELKPYDTLGLNRGLNCTPSVGGLNLSASTLQLPAQ